jgi:Ca-activated chloride channel family protein
MRFNGSWGVMGGVVAVSLWGCGVSHAPMESATVDAEEPMSVAKVNDEKRPEGQAAAPEAKPIPDAAATVTREERAKKSEDPAASALPNLAGGEWSEQAGAGGLGLRGIAQGGGGSADGLGGLGTKGAGAGSGYGGPVATGSPVSAEPPPPPARPAKPRDDADRRVVTEKENVGDLGRYRDATPVIDTPPVNKYADWGGKIYLSNDDAMSLASAQRVLWSAERGQVPSLGEIRPHEMLNYFSFDSTTPDASQALDVTVSAQRVGADHLKMTMTVKGAVPERRPLDLTLVLDHSGSMSADGRMAYLKRSLRMAAKQLQPGDHVDMVLFDDSVDTVLTDYTVPSGGPAKLLAAIDAMEIAGGTNLNAGLEEGYRLAQKREQDPRRNRRMMLITDAQLNVGSVNHDVVSEIGEAYDKSGIRLTVVGVGTDVNDDFLDMLSEKGQGAYVYLGSEAVVDRLFGTGWTSLTETIAEDVHFELDLPESLAVEKFYGEESSTVKADVQATHFAAGSTQTFFQDLVVKDGHVVGDDKISFEATFLNPRTRKAETRTFTTKVSSMLESDAHNVHKATALMAWTDLLMGQAQTGRCQPKDMQSYANSLTGLKDDMEVGYVTKLVEKSCGALPGAAAPQSLAAVSVKIRVDSDIPIAEVALACGGENNRRALSGGSSVVTLDGHAGSCDLTLEGAVAMATTVQVPSGGADVRCVVRAGRMSCIR